MERICSERSSNSKLLCNKTELKRNKTENALKQKRGFLVVSRHTRNPPTEVGQELAGITVFTGPRDSSGLEDVLVFQCALFRNLAGGGQLAGQQHRRRRLQTQLNSTA